MDKCGDADDCVSTPEASEQAAKFAEENIKNLPVPGEVEFINGGPPCQVCYCLHLGQNIINHLFSFADQLLELFILLVRDFLG